MEPTFKFTEVQRKLAETTLNGVTRIVGFGGAIRGTKTWGGIGLLILLCRMFPRSRWAIVRKDLPTLRRNTIPSFNKLRQYASGFVGEINQSTWTSTCANGSEIIFFPESREGDTDLTRWKGLEVNGFLLEEADELSVKSFHKAQERAGAWFVPDGEQPPSLIICTFNPSGGWVKDTFYTPWKNGTIKAPYAFIPATILDNPYASDAYKAGLKSLPEAEYKRFVEGDWEVLAGRYFDELDREVHLPKPALFQKTDLGQWDIPRWWECWGSYDWGFQHDAVCCAFTKDGRGQTYLLDTLWMQRLNDDQQAHEIKSFLPLAAHKEIYAGHDCWARPIAHGGTAPQVSEVFAASGLGLIKAAIDRKPGWGTLRRALTLRQADGSLGTPRLLMNDTPGNRKLFDQLLALECKDTDPEDVWKKKAEDLGIGDDGADALRYGVATRFPTPSEPEGYQDPWQPGHDKNALVPFEDQTQNYDIGGGGISTWGF